MYLDYWTTRSWKDRASEVCVERLASRGRTEVLFSRLFLVELHFETLGNCGCQSLTHQANRLILWGYIQVWRPFCCRCRLWTPTPSTLRRQIRGRRSRCALRWRGGRCCRGSDIDIRRSVVRCRRRCHCDGSTHGVEECGGWVMLGNILCDLALSCDSQFCYVLDSSKYRFGASCVFLLLT